MAAPQAVETGGLKIHPDTFVVTWNRWLEECQDWCISRQLWWGHRVPAWWADISDAEVGRAPFARLVGSC
jgi:valyl-tRNA synthetase